MKTFVLGFIEMMLLSLAEHCYSDQRKYSAMWRERKKTSKKRSYLVLLCVLLHDPIHIPAWCHYSFYLVLIFQAPAIILFTSKK
jgi:hypothetical protein